MDQTPDNLDPRIGQSASAQRIDALIFNSLVRKNERAELIPDVALRWEMPDPTTYVFHLRDDVQFHDGRPLTSKDVKYTFTSMLNGTVITVKAGHPYNLITGITTPDPTTVIFTLREPFAPFLWDIANGVIGIVPDGSGNDFFRHPIGSGPFEFVRYIQDQELVLKRNDSYFAKKAAAAALRFKIIPEEVVVALELRKGTVDLELNSLSPDMVETLRKDKSLNVFQADGTNVQYFAFNLLDPVFSDRRVREALAYAIDRETILKYLWRGQGKVAASILPPNNWAYTADLKTYPYNPQRARELLHEAGQDHLQFTYRLNNDNGTAIEMAEIFQRQFSEVGVNMQIQGNEFATFFADIIKGNFQTYSLRWVGANTDPDIFNLVFYSKSVPPNGANRGHYSNPRVDQLIEFARRETDMDKRKMAYAEIQQIVVDDLPYINLFYLDVIAVANKRVRGVTLLPTGDYDFLTNVYVNN
ncbi:MAG TPA: ABC transporter substrate-binding protein [Terriglobia bacterium]|nr:ABC transporter substrate-binding protein [Terriglobia bacterium]